MIMNSLQLTAFAIGASGLIIVLFLWLGLFIDYKKQKQNQ